MRIPTQFSSRIFVCLIDIVFVLVSCSPTLAQTKPPIELVLRLSKPSVLERHQKFTVELRNHSKSDVTFATAPSIKELRFIFETVEGSRAVSRFEELEKSLVDNNVSIKPNGSFVFEIEFGGASTPWSNVPPPSRTKRYRFWATCNVQLADSKSSIQLVSQSRPISVRTHRDHSFHALMAQGFRDAAIEVLDREWDKLNSYQIGENSSLGPIHVAAMHGDIELAKYILDRGVDVDMLTNDTNLTALWIATEPEMVKFLIQRGANVSHKCNGTYVLDDATYLFHRSGDAQKRQSLREKINLLVNADALHGITFAACFYDSAQFTQFLAEKVPREDIDLIRSAVVTFGRVDLVGPAADIVGAETLLPSDNDLVLVEALVQKPAMLMAFINLGFDPRTVRYRFFDKRLARYGLVELEVSSMELAAFQGAPESIAILEDAGVSFEASVKREAPNLIALAVFGENDAMVDALIERTHQLDEPTQKEVFTSALRAAFYDPEVVDRLVGVGAAPDTELVKRACDIYLRTRHRETAKQTISLLASKISDLDLLTCVILEEPGGVSRAFSRPHKVSPDELSKAVEVTAFTGNIEVMKLLMQAGGEIRSGIQRPDYFRPGTSLLHVASYNGQTKMIRFLVGHGIDPNIKGPGGNTAIHFAASEGQVDAIRVLLRLGASPNLRNDYQQTPIDLARADPNLPLDVVRLITTILVRAEN